MSWCEAGCPAKCQVREGKKDRGKKKKKRGVGREHLLAKKENVEDQNRIEGELKNETMMEERGE